MQGPITEKIDASKYDIIFIDNMIKKKLRNVDQKINTLKDDLETAKWIFDNGKEVDRKIAEVKIDTLKKRIQDLTCGFEFAYYILSTEDIINEYKSMSIVKKENTFIKKKKVQEDDISVLIKKRMLIINYIRIAKQYCDIENINIKNIIMCNNCHSTEFEETDEPNIFLCKKCASEHSQLDTGPSYKDIERIKSGAELEPDPDLHFINAMNRFEGKQSKSIPRIVINTIRDDLIKQHVNIETCSKKQVYELLQCNKGFNKYYADINLIHFEISGQQPKDISHIRNELLEMHREYISVNKDEGDINERNVNFKLFKFLQLLDFDCNREEFFFLKDPKNESVTYEKHKKKIEELQIKYPNAVTSNGKKRWRYIHFY